MSERGPIQDIEKLEQMLIIDEGIRLLPYQDTLGNWTVGIGHLLLGGFDPFRPLSLHAVADLLAGDIEIAYKGALRCVGSALTTLEVPRQHAIINMVFNLGETKFKLFHRTLDGIRNKNWNHVGNCLGQTRWFSQVKNRAVRVVDTIRHGVYAKGYDL